MIILPVMLMGPVGCMSPGYSSLYRYQYASGVQKFASLVCQSSSARAEGKMLRAYDLDTQAWQILKDYRLKNPPIVHVFQLARKQGQKYYFKKAPESCRQWSILLSATEASNSL